MYGSTTTELSLNTPARCLTSVPNDTQHHRFLVAPCALPASSGDDPDGGNGNGNGDGDPLSPTTTTNRNRTTNPLYLLRYHEDMNELAIDASLTFPTSAERKSGGSSSNSSSSSGGEIWNCSSCPSDKSLVVTNRESASGGGGGAETVLWRIPSESFREDEYDPYYQGDGEDDPYQSAMYGKGRSSSSLEQTHPILEEVVNLTQLQAENNDASANQNSWTGRISDMQWNPDSIPELNDSITSHSTSNSAGSGAGGATFITVEQGTHRITTWDLNTACPIRIDDIVSLPYPAAGGATSRRRGRLDTLLTVHPKLSWDPHNTNTCAVTQGSHVHFMDLRSRSSSSSSSLHSMGGLKGCHALGVTHVDHNPNKPHVICTSGQDGLVKFWDVRSASSSLYEDHQDDEMGGVVRSTNSGGGGPTTTTLWKRQEPLKILRGGHSHWTTIVKYNPNHDQLLLSGGTDGMVNLWRISSISSAPLLDLGDAAGGAQDGNAGSGRGGGSAGGAGGGLPHAFSDIHVSFDSDDNDFDSSHRRPSSIMTPTAASADETSVNTDGGNAPDVRVNKMEMSEAVYDVAWSAADPWIYLSLGYDGTVVLNHVPSEEKYKILL